MLKELSFYFIRHGETDWNRHNRYQGHTDVRLNQRGREQAEEHRNLAAKLGITDFFSSPLQRALETAGILAGDSPVQIIESLKECGCPETSARIYHDLGLNIPDFSHATVIKPESKEQFIQRSLEGVNRALEAARGNPLIVAHGGTYWSLCKHMGLVPGKIPNCTPIHFQPKDSGWSADCLDSCNSFVTD